jgi:hypothetical protein
MKAARALAAVAFTFLAAEAAAQNLVLNPSFETGDTTSWVQGGGLCTFDVLTPGPGVTTTGAGVFPVQSPTQGTQLLMTDAGAPGVCTLSQDIVLPAGQTYIASAGLGYNYHDFLDPAGTGCSVTVDVTTTLGAPIANLFQASGGANVPISPRAPVALPHSAGTTVRLIITATSCNGGPVGVVADNFVVGAGALAASTVPTMSEWAMLLMALMMALTAALALRRRGNQ